MAKEAQNGKLFDGEQAADGAGRIEALLDIEVAGGLVKHVHIGVLNAHHGAGKALQLSAFVSVCDCVCERGEKSKSCG